MNLVVLDPRFLLDVFRDPVGVCARLFLVLAYGRATLLTRFAEAGEQALSSLAYQPLVTAQTNPTAVLRMVCEEAARVKSVLTAPGALPSGTPAGWGLGMTEQLFLQVAQGVDYLRSHEDPLLDPKLVRTVIELHVAHYDPFPGPVPSHFTWSVQLPSGLEALVHNALLLGASYLVTDDHRLTGVGGKRTFKAPDGRTVCAARFSHFVEHELEGPGFSLERIRNPATLKLSIVPPRGGRSRAPARRGRFERG